MITLYVDKNIPKILLVKLLKPLWPGVVFTPLSPFRKTTVPDPPLPGDQWVRVKNRQCGICGTDITLLMAEVHPAIAPAALPGTDRLYLGHEVVGTVSETGTAVSQFAIGDRVTLDTRFQGATCISQEISPACRHCQSGNFMLCENASVGKGPEGIGGGWGDSFIAHQSEVYKIPPELSDDQAMLIEPFSTGVRTAIQHRPQAGDQVLIIGSGFVGLNLVQCLKAVQPDCEITIMARYPHQAEIAATLGADTVLLREKDLFGTAVKQTAAKKYSGPLNNTTVSGGFDIVYDCVGSRRTLNDGLRVSRAGGSLVMVGIKMTPHKLDVSPVWHQEVKLAGVMAHGMEEWDGKPQPTYDVVVEFIKSGKLRSDVFITHRFKLSEWRRAIKTAMDKRTGAVKVVFDYGIDD